MRSEIAVLMALAMGCTEPRAGDFSVATFNILHGLFCPANTDQCRLDDRIALLAKWIERTGCPDVVALQEVSQPVDERLEQELPSLCGGRYEKAYQVVNSFDDAIVLTRFPIVKTQTKSLTGALPFRFVLWTELDVDGGSAHILTTHLASEADLGGEACGENCPEPCRAAGAVTFRDCQAVETRLFAQEQQRAGEPVVVTGDLNAPPGSFVYQQFADAGWIDAYLSSGNSECDPSSGEGCTSGRIDDQLTDLEQSERRQTARIDYAFLGSGSHCTVEPRGDADGDGIATGIFPPGPNQPCGPRPEEICWPSDHDGVILDLQCGN